MAAKKVFVHAEPKTIGYQFATEKVLAGTSEELRREELRSLTDPEIREKLEAELGKLPPSIQVVFANKQCQACGQVGSQQFKLNIQESTSQTGDSRLMDDICHRTLKKGHTGKLKQRFSKVQVPDQPHHCDHDPSSDSCSGGCGCRGCCWSQCRSRSRLRVCSPWASSRHGAGCCYDYT